ncbi:M48 family metallopeptidase [Pseudooceanicola aestuarii]|uniref:M48 family metallopeptidase n=1 Tax=Pseudooceanicola aestuarii TaxID=2697319 RepID=UPI0013D1901D|nr:SprT family zinc-dependent metalloprotease [Pseudooceanicola aestuarii]
MGEVTLPGNPPLGINLRHSARARRMTLRVSALDGRITLTLPRGASAAQGLAFAREKEPWLRRHSAGVAEVAPVVAGLLLPVEGQPRLIVPTQGRRLRLLPDRLEVPGPSDRLPARLAAWLKTMARDRLAAAADRHAARLGRPYTRLTLRDTRSRWGSCTMDGRLMFSWRLIMAPPEVLDYVAAHEVAHLAEMNHSPAFWAHVTALYGDWQPQRLWLRQHGTGLHRYRFEA